MAELKRSNIYGNLNLRSMTYPEVDANGNPKKDKDGNIITKTVSPSFKTKATPKNKDGATVQNTGATKWVESETVGTGFITALHEKLQNKLGRSEEISVGYYCGRKLQTITEEANAKAIVNILSKYSAITPAQREQYLNGYLTLADLEKIINPKGNGAMFKTDELPILKKQRYSPWRMDTEEIKDDKGNVTETKAVVKARLIGDHIRIFGRMKYLGEAKLNGNLTNKVILRLQLKGMKGKKIKKIWRACGNCAGFGSAASIYVENVDMGIKQRSAVKDATTNKWTYNGTSFSSCPHSSDNRTPEDDGSIWLDIKLSALATATEKKDKLSFYINCPVTFEK